MFFTKKCLWEEKAILKAEILNQDLHEVQENFQRTQLAAGMSLRKDLTKLMPLPPRTAPPPALAKSPGKQSKLVFLHMTEGSSWASEFVIPALLPAAYKLPREEARNWGS